MDYGLAFKLNEELYNNNIEFKKLIDIYTKTNQVRYFGDSEYQKIIFQNFIPIVPDAKEFIDMFRLGYNSGNCAMMARILSYSYDDVDIVSGVLPLPKGTFNAEKEGGHVWLEDNYNIIDTSLMLVIDKSLKKEFGYIEEERLTAADLRKSPRYMARKEFVRDTSLQKR